MSSATAAETPGKPGAVERILGVIERVGNKVPHPAILFLALCIGVIVLSALLFSIGTIGVLVRRNAIIVFMSVELMLLAVNINLVSISAYLNDITGQIWALEKLVTYYPKREHWAELILQTEKRANQHIINLPPMGNLLMKFRFFKKVAIEKAKTMYA